MAAAKTPPYLLFALNEDLGLEHIGVLLNEGPEFVKVAHVKAVCEVDEV